MQVPAQQQTQRTGGLLGLFAQQTRLRRYRRVAWRFVLNKPLGAAGLAIISLTLFVAIFGDFIIRHDPLQMDPTVRLQAPSSTYWFGTDNFGRDVYSHIIGGARISIYVGFMSVFIGAGVGGVWGLTSGYLGGKFDLYSQRLVDIKQAIPTLALALVVVASLGSSLNNVVIAISLGSIGGATRVVRSQAIAVRNMPYIEAVHSIGASWPRIVFRHVMPNCAAPWIIVATAGLGSAILTEASLSFLGVGVPPPSPSWGRMLSGVGREYLLQSPWLSLSPGFAIMVVVLAFNLFGDALRDVLDPKLRGSGRR